MLAGRSPASSIMFRMRTFSFSLLGTSTPMVCRPGRGATTRTAPTPSARAMSLDRFETWLTLIQAANSNSNRVTTGPVSAATTRAVRLNSASNLSRAVALDCTTFSWTAAYPYSGSAKRSRGGRV